MEVVGHDAFEEELEQGLESVVFGMFLRDPRLLHIIIKECQIFDEETHSCLIHGESSKKMPPVACMRTKRNFITLAFRRI